MTALILPKLGMCKNSDEAVRELERMGARPCGTGDFSKVFRVDHYEHDPRAPNFLDYRAVAKMNPWEMMQPIRMASERVTRIIKVTKRPDTGALVVAKAAMACAEVDPLAPKYYGVTDFGGGHFMAEMEALRPLDNMEHHRGLTGSREGAISAYEQKRVPTAEAIAASPFLTLLAAYVKDDGWGGYKWDIHSDNVMMRGGQPVVTDPIFMSKQC